MLVRKKLKVIDIGPVFAIDCQRENGRSTEIYKTLLKKKRFLEHVGLGVSGSVGYI